MTYRQILRRAKDRIEARTPRFPASREEHAQLLNAFAGACTSGDLQALRNLLSDQVTLWSDGGGRAAATLRPLTGGDIVAKFLLGQMRRKQGLTIAFEDVNGKPTIISRRPDGEVQDVVDVVVDQGKIVAIYAVRNPEKLRQLSS